MDTERVIEGGRLRAIDPADVGVHAISGATAHVVDRDVAENHTPDTAGGERENKPDPQS